MEVSATLGPPILEIGRYEYILPEQDKSQKCGESSVENSRPHVSDGAFHPLVSRLRLAHHERMP